MMWTADELERIGSTEEAEITSRQRDGTLRKAVTVWVVRDGDDLYVRSVNGPDGAWFRSTKVRHEGHIRAGGIGKDITFVESDPSMRDRIDGAYRTKYRRYAGKILNSILTPKAQAATLKLVPRP